MKMTTYAPRFPDPTGERSFLRDVHDYIQDLVGQESSGTLKAICDTHFSGAGKDLRPKIVFRLSNALNVDAKRMRLVRNWASALELLHNATLIHDDLQDGDPVRRNQPAIWARFGANDAINAGDFLLTAGPMAIDAGIDGDFQARLALHRLYAKTASQLVNGQSLEFEMRRNLGRPDCLAGSYWRCAELKTSSLFSGAALGVAILSGLAISDSEYLAEIFNQIGVLFQLQDDLVDIFGDKKRGQVACDLREGKISCLVLNHFKLYPEEALELTSHLRRERSQISEAQIHHWIGRFRDGGALQLALMQIEERRANISRYVDLLGRNGVAKMVAQLQMEFLKPIEAIMAKGSHHA